MSIYYSILFGIDIVDWEMHESPQQGVVILPNPLAEMYYEGFQAVWEKL